jgi:hypothetical protein
MIDFASASAEIKREALNVSGEILKDIEGSEIPLSNIALKALRLAKLLNETDYIKIFEYEVGGYPRTKGGIKSEVRNLAHIAGRTYLEKDDETGKEVEYVYTESLKGMEDAKVASPLLKLLPSIDSAKLLKEYRTKHLELLNSRRLFIHDYASKNYYELKFSNATNDAFSRIQKRVDSKIDRLVPKGVQRFAVIYDYLRSDKPEQWSDAVHDCRRILKDLADAIFPPQSQPRIKILQGKKKEIKLGDEDYVNRLICFIEDNSESERFNELVGSHLDFMGNRLDGIYRAANKGSHTDITSREEADRCVVYTYMIVGDILSLLPRGNQSAIEGVLTISNCNQEADYRKEI